MDFNKNMNKLRNQLYINKTRNLDLDLSYFSREIIESEAKKEKETEEINIIHTLSKEEIEKVLENDLKHEISNIENELNDKLSKLHKLKLDIEKNYNILNAYKNLHEYVKK